MTRVGFLFNHYATHQVPHAAPYAFELSRRHPNLHVVYALSDPPDPADNWQGDRGFVHLAVDKYLQPGGRRQAFLCGPPLMIEAVTRVLEQKGLQPADIFYDKF